MCRRKSYQNFIHSSISRYIGSNVCKNGGDIRDVISAGRLVRKRTSRDRSDNADVVRGRNEGGENVEPNLDTFFDVDAHPIACHLGSTIPVALR
jgi:hypothetical protein